MALTYLLKLEVRNCRYASVVLLFYQDLGSQGWVFLEPTSMGAGCRPD